MVQLATAWTPVESLWGFKSGLNILLNLKSAGPTGEMSGISYINMDVIWTSVAFLLL